MFKWRDGERSIEAVDDELWTLNKRKYIINTSIYKSLLNTEPAAFNHRKKYISIANED